MSMNVGEFSRMYGNSALVSGADRNHDGNIDAAGRADRGRVRTVVTDTSTAKQINDLISGLPSGHSLFVQNPSNPNQYFRVTVEVGGRISVETSSGERGPSRVTGAAITTGYVWESGTRRISVPNPIQGDGTRRPVHWRSAMNAIINSLSASNGDKIAARNALRMIELGIPWRKVFRVSHEGNSTKIEIRNKAELSTRILHDPDLIQLTGAYGLERNPRSGVTGVPISSGPGSPSSVRFTNVYLFNPPLEDGISRPRENAGLAIEARVGDRNYSIRFARGSDGVMRIFCQPRPSYREDWNNFRTILREFLSNPAGLRDFTGNRAAILQAMRAIISPTGPNNTIRRPIMEHSLEDPGPMNDEKRSTRHQFNTAHPISGISGVTHFVFVTHEDRASVDGRRYLAEHMGNIFPIENDKVDLMPHYRNDGSSMIAGPEGAGAAGISHGR